MVEMNPYYAHESSVGPVFDITRWTGRGVVNMALAGLLVGSAIVAAAAFAYEPGWFFKKPPEGFEELVKGIRKAHKTHTWAMRGGITAAGLFGGFCVLGSVGMLGDMFRRDYYLRAGEGGLCLRLPWGVSWRHFGLVSRALELELPWDDIEQITVTQTKQLGALSRNAGNISAEMKLTTRSGQRYVVSLEGLEAASYLIYDRLQEFREMTPASIGA